MRRITSVLFHPLSALLGFYLVIVVIVMPPTGDALLSDDWDFSISVFDWIREGQLTLSDFPSMTLISHLVWGKCFATIFGSSQWTLRISTMVMAWIGALALYRICRREGCAEPVATSFSAAYLFNPMLLFCSYTFLTDVAGCSLMLVFLSSVVPRMTLFADTLSADTLSAGEAKPGTAVPSNDRTTPQRVSLLAGAIFVGALTAVCYLTRQTALIPVIAAAILMTPVALRGRLRLLTAVVTAVAFLAPVLAFWSWISMVHGIPIGFEKAMLEFGQLLQPKIVVMKSIRLLLTIGFYLSPFGVGALICARRGHPARKQAFVLLTIFSGSLACFMLAPLRSARLYWGFHSFDFNTGHYPHVDGLRDWLVPTEYSVGILSMSIFDVVAIPLSVTSLVSVVVYRKRFEWLVRQMFADLFHGKPPSIAATATLAAAGQFLLLLMVWDLFDRYVLPLFTLCSVVVAVLFAMNTRSANDHRRMETVRPISLPAVGGLYAVLLGVAVYSICWTHDTRARFEAAWDAGEQLVRSGVPASSIDLGAAFRGTFVYRPALSDRLNAGASRLGQLSDGERANLIGRVGSRQYRVSQRPVAADSATPLFQVTPKTWMPSESWTVYRVNSPSDPDG